MRRYRQETGRKKGRFIYRAGEPKDFCVLYSAMLEPTKSPAARPRCSRRFGTARTHGISITFIIANHNMLGNLRLCLTRPAVSLHCPKLPGVPLGMPTLQRRICVQRLAPSLPNSRHHYDLSMSLGSGGNFRQGKVGPGQILR